MFRALGLRLLPLALGLLVLGCGREQEPQAAASSTKPAAPETVALRFRPLDKLNHREHWVYDTAVPGSGLGRNALSFEVALAAKLDQDSFAVRKVVRAHHMLLGGKKADAPSLAGVTFTYAYGRDHSLVSEIAAEAKSPELSAAARLVAQLGRFGTLIEYPDQPVGERDSWSIEPRQLMIVPGLEATLRPTYTVESLGKAGPERTATIATDIQVDVVPIPLAEGIGIEGGGTASGTMRVRVRDGVLVEARSVMHFSQELTVQGSEILGYREFSATSHVFIAPSTSEVDLLGQPYTVEAPEHDPECDLQVASAMQRVGNLPAQKRVYPLHALRGLALPAVAGGEPLREAGVSLVLFTDPKQVELDGRAADTKTLGAALRAATATGDASKPALYVYADASLPLERLKALLGVLPARMQARLVVRDARVSPAAPKAVRWLDERLRLAAAQPTHEEREKRLHELLTAHLALCEPALAAAHVALGDAAAWARLPSTLVSKFLGCGCTATNLESLEALLETLYGTPDLRFVALPRTPSEQAVPLVTVGELAKQLAAGKPRKPL